MEAWKTARALAPAVAAMLCLGAPAPPALADGAAATQGEAGPPCSGECRGLGIEKVKAGDEHCGLVPRERKDTALDAACTLAESHREELQAYAEEQARGECAAVERREGCRCEGELRRWQNVYTHVFSQRCWTECGWAFLLQCQRDPRGEAPAPEPPAVAPR